MPIPVPPMNFALDRQNSDLRCEILDLERQGALWLYENLKNKVLGQSGESVGRTAAAAPEGGAASRRPDARERRQRTRRTLAPPVPESPETARHNAPEILDLERSVGRTAAAAPERGAATSSRRPYARERRQRTRRTLAPPVLEPPETARHNTPEDRGERVFGALCTDSSTRNRAAVFRAAGVGYYTLTPEEATCARNTPDVPWKTFTNLFGGIFHAERPVGKTVPGYGRFLCTHDMTQPRAPTRPGEPGLILSPPGVPSLDIVHVLVAPTVGGEKAALQYCGIYRKVQSMEVQVDVWHALPKTCRSKLLVRVREMTVGDVHARCSLRMRGGYTSDPSPAEIQEWLQRYYQGSETLERRAIQNSFNCGAERFSLEVIKCVGYDTQMAELIQRRINRRRHVR